MKTALWAYAIWIPLTIGYNYLMCWIPVKYTGYPTKMYLLMTICALIPTWSIAAYLSRELMIDSLIYDSLLVISSIIIFKSLGQAQNLSLINWIGIMLAVVGVIAAKYGHGEH